MPTPKNSSRTGTPNLEPAFPARMLTNSKTAPTNKIFPAFSTIRLRDGWDERLRLPDTEGTTPHQIYFILRLRAKRLARKVFSGYKKEGSARKRETVACDGVCGSPSPRVAVQPGESLAVGVSSGKRETRMRSAPAVRRFGNVPDQGRANGLIVKRQPGELWNGF